MGGQIEYARRYLQKRYGKDPDDERIPLFFLMNNTVTMRQALDLKFWANTGLKYIRSHFTDSNAPFVEYVSAVQLVVTLLVAN